MRQSINVVRLSRIAQSNLEKEGDGSDYTTAEARGSDIRIETADAELDFEEVKEEGEGPEVENEEHVNNTWVHSAFTAPRASVHFRIAHQALSGLFTVYRVTVIVLHWDCTG